MSIVNNHPLVIGMILFPDLTQSDLNEVNSSVQPSVSKLNS